MSFVHHLLVGCFELHPELLCPIEREPTALRPLDFEWVDRHLAAADPRLAEQFWMSKGRCLQADLYGAGARRGDEILALAVEVARHHGDGFLVVHKNNGDVIYPEAMKERQRLWRESFREGAIRDGLNG